MTGAPNSTILKFDVENFKIRVCAYLGGL